MISYEKFEQIIEHIQQQIDKDKKLTEYLHEILLDGYSVCKISDVIVEDLIQVLQIDLLDKVDTIEWWIWECDFGKQHPTIVDGGTTYVLDTIKKLYDYLVDNYKKSLMEDLENMIKEHEHSNMNALDIFNLINKEN